MLSNELVEPFFSGNSEEHVMMYADQLKNGMVVLIVDVVRNQHYMVNPSPRDVEDWNRVDRWCEVSRVREDDDIVRFMGVYAEGPVIIRESQKFGGWWVMKDSIVPEKVVGQGAAYAFVMQCLRDLARLQNDLVTDKTYSTMAIQIMNEVEVGRDHRIEARKPHILKVVIDIVDRILVAQALNEDFDHTTQIDLAVNEIITDLKDC